jgi:general secretion pathway protein A
MFLQHFKLKEQPFGATPDPRFLFQGNSHREALASLHCGFHGNRGFTVLIAEPGMGKTTLLFEFLTHIQDRARTVFLFNTFCNPDDVISFILQELGIIPSQTLADRHRQLNEVLIAEARAGRRFVLVIDEAQNLTTDALEVVRMLSNYETPRSKLMQVFLAGQPRNLRTNWLDLKLPNFGSEYLCCAA